METFSVELADGITFTYRGPQTDRRVYFGTVGPTPEFNARVIDALLADLEPVEAGPPGPNSPVTAVATSSSPWALIQFEDSRLPWLTDRLRDIVARLVTPPPPPPLPA
jgi:hypothetical protein